MLNQPQLQCSSKCFCCVRVCRLVTLAAGQAAGKFLKYQPGAPTVGVQTAYGIEAEVEGYSEAYDTESMLFMDFRRHHTGLWDDSAMRWAWVLKRMRLHLYGWGQARAGSSMCLCACQCTFVALPLSQGVASRAPGLNSCAMQVHASMPVCIQLKQQQLAHNQCALVPRITSKRSPCTDGA